MSAHGYFSVGQEAYSAVYDGTHSLEDVSINDASSARPDRTCSANFRWRGNIEIVPMG